MDLVIYLCWFLFMVVVSGVVLLWGVALTLFDLVLVYTCDSLIYIKRAYVFDTMSLVRGRKLCQGSRLDSPKD